MSGITDCIKNNPGSLDGAPPLQCLDVVIKNFIGLAFLFLGVVCMIFLLYGAVRYILAGGDVKAIKSARDTIIYAVIGTVLVLSTYIIANVALGIFYPGGTTILNFSVIPHP